MRALDGAAPPSAALTREVRLACEATRAAPDVRAARVAAVRQRIAAGAYRIPDALLAERLLTFRG
ncbi:MAG: flagellar biosynthesis anti-sigma factor FlgM [Chloroflexi bacterium]|nr:flagellar biosynthesis anti-sigma factor FlgM [Chloroflexota bacterium]